jgi:exodeoxyribonuclease VII large subunit
VRVIVYPVPVQGSDAGARIAQMLARVGERAEVDAILLVRGGGSIEDLWAFNEEVVARAIRACPIPVVVGVGHESDFTIADFAADVRAPTPTAAAELVAPETAALHDEMASQLKHLARQLRSRLQDAAQRIDYAQRSLAAPRAPIVGLESRVAGLRSRAAAAAARVVGGAGAQVAGYRARWLRARPSLQLDVLAGRRGRLLAAGEALLAARAVRLQPLAARLAALNPSAVLDRGYAIALAADGRAVTDVAALACGDPLRIVLARGTAGVRVETLDGKGPLVDEDVA